MSTFLLASLGGLTTLAVIAIGDLAGEKVRDLLDHLPHWILRLAAMRLDPALRAVAYEDEWLPELTYILKGDEARPVIRLFHGTRYSIGIMFSARRIVAPLKREAPDRDVQMEHKFGRPHIYISSSRKSYEDIYAEAIAADLRISKPKGTDRRPVKRVGRASRRRRP